MQISVDKSTLDLLQRGDEGMYRTIFVQLQPALVAYASEYVIDKDLSKSLVQEAFFKLWETRQKLKVGTNLNAYLYKSVRNICLNYLRHLKVTDKYAQNIITAEYKLNYEALKDKSAERLLEAEILEHINSAVEKMTPQCQQLFIMSRFEGKSHKEIAKELCITEKTVENQIGKALKVARAELKEFLPITIMLYTILS